MPPQIASVRENYTIDLDESGGWLIESTGVAATDSDILSDIASVEIGSDGVADASDNCILAADSDQRDTDGDGFGNACDADLNGDCSVAEVGS